jgi:2'-hydroxybiphenyl-2-sulfinate desulfinase
MPQNELKEIHYTICPVGNSSYIAAKKGWLSDGLAKLGVKPVLLQTLPKEHWKAHFDYQDDVLFREGGNTPPLWARSNGADVVLIGLALLKQKQGILVRADSPVTRIEQLRGRRIAIPAHPNALIDFHKASAEQGFKLALASHGVDISEVNSVIISSGGDFLTGTLAGKDVARKADGSDSLEAEEIKALDRGEADAIYIKLSRFQGLLDTGRYKLLFDIAADPAQLLPINNEYPNTLTVSRYLAEEHPDVVTAYVKQLLLAAGWAKTHRAEAVEILAEQTFGTVAQFIGSNAADFNEHITPNLSDESLSALEGRKKFLYDNGYLKEDFALEKWADDRFLKAAWKEIQEDEKRSPAGGGVH